MICGHRNIRFGCNEMNGDCYVMYCMSTYDVLDHSLPTEARAKDHYHYSLHARQRLDSTKAWHDSVVKGRYCFVPCQQLYHVWRFKTQVLMNTWVPSYIRLEIHTQYQTITGSIFNHTHSSHEVKGTENSLMCYEGLFHGRCSTMQLRDCRNSILQLSCPL